MKKLFVSLLFMLFIGCTGALRNSDRIRDERRFVWYNSELSSVEPEQAIEKIGTADTFRKENDLALVYVKMLSLDKAESLFLKLIFSKSVPVEVYANASLLYAVADEPESVQRVYNALLSRKDISDAHLNHLLQTLIKQERKQEEALLLDLLNRAGRVMPYTALRLGDLAMNATQYEKAKVYYERALDFDPKSSHAMEGMGRIAFMAKDYLTAARRFEDAMQYNKSSSIGCLVARSYALANEHAHAVKVYSENQCSLGEDVALYGKSLLTLDFRNRPEEILLAKEIAPVLLNTGDSLSFAGRTANHLHQFAYRFNEKRKILQEWYGNDHIDSYKKARKLLESYD